MAKEKWVKRQPFQGKTAIVCGGSKGIGKATAEDFVRLGGGVCIVARDPEVLEQTAERVRGLKVKPSQIVETIACDTSDMEKLKPLFSNFIDEFGVPDYLLNVVGFAYPQYIENQTLEDFKRTMDVNYYGQLVPILILLPYFKEAKKGHIANVSSMLGYMGMSGYTTYTPSKFAVVGLSEALRSELKPYNITVSILYPPDTDTPGFELETIAKPEEVKIVSERAKLMSAEEVAEVFLEGVLNKKLHILPGDANYIWRLNRLFPGLVRFIMDQDFRKARQQVSSN
jgi:3-dehydrosphinganine reductase